MVTEETRRDPENYIRINISKTAKEYRAETTVSVKWEGDLSEGIHRIGALLRISDEEARREITTRERIDSEQGEQG